VPVRIGSSSPVFRVGAAAASAIYLGASKVWQAASGATASLLVRFNASPIADTSTVGHSLSISGVSLASDISPTGYSYGYFDGSGGVSIYPTDSSLDFGTGDFTIEFWMQAATLDDIVGLLQHRSIDGGFNSGQWQLMTFGGGKLLWYSSSLACISDSSIPTGEWVHVAVVRVGTNMEMFINGTKQAGTYCESASLTGGDDAAFNIGFGIGGLSHYDGYMAGLRIIKGTAIYWNSFTPATVISAIPSTNIATVSSGTSPASCICPEEGTYLYDGCDDCDYGYFYANGSCGTYFEIATEGACCE
jgi:hypothetical protein